jgi:predicted metal-dependent enzyme (double-stranded beta helix superfamily)
MSKFNIQGLAAELEQAVADSSDKQAAVSRVLRKVMQEQGPQTIIEALEASVPNAASIGELIAYKSPQLTVLYGKVPPRFRSAIHDHTVFACIAQLTGEETSVIYEPTEDGKLRVAQSTTGRPGDVVELPVDAIHHIENPCDEISTALHVYGGDFGAVMEDRSLWTHDDHAKSGFSFEKLLKLSVVAMKDTGNDKGVAAVAEALPAAKPMIDAL